MVCIPQDEAWTPGSYAAFKILMSARLCAALWTGISDCDETYNYWEPVSTSHLFLFLDFPIHLLGRQELPQ